MNSRKLAIERCNQGRPILAPTRNWWENGVTFNAAAVYLERSPENEPVIRALLPMFGPHDPALADGVVAIHYRARPEIDPGSAYARSFIGLALFTPRLEPLYRYQEPVVFPSPDPAGFDHFGVEDPRITRIDGSFYMVYCGVMSDPLERYRAVLGMARSEDLLHWEKLGPLEGELNRASNKDGVLFPDRIDGKYYLLHRPSWNGLGQPDFAISLAVSSSPGGPWRDQGEIMHAWSNPRFAQSWIGAGSVPIRIAGRRYAVIYHTGNYFPNLRDREYDLDAALLDFERFRPEEPASLVTARLEHLMTPETPAELHSHSTLMVGNVLFTCGSYQFQDEIYIVYGGADTYTLAARVSQAALFEALSQADLANPHTS